MFRKTLIIEDIDSISLGITALLKNNFTTEIHTTKYCDEAYLKIKKAIIQGFPFDLIITDLSFKEDPGRESAIKSGEALIKRLAEEKIRPKIIVYSIEDQPYLIKSLFSTGSINGFVEKGRESTNELIEAIHSLAKGIPYIPSEFANLLKEKSFFHIDQYDIDILKLLSEGYTQEDISRVFKENKFPSASTSSIEKKINRLKLMLKANNSIQLIAIAKDMKII